MATLGQVRTSYRDTPLWQALAGMRIEREGASATFARRLGLKQRWSKRHTYAVIEEYRRFLYLAATGESAVTPSDHVDEAWHLHLTYTRHYWDELCGRILGKPLHHDPTEGGTAQQAHFKDQNSATLARYEVVFGEPPRPDVWPAPAAQFRVEQPRRWPRLFAAGATTLAVTACTALSGAAGTGGILTMVLGGGLLVLLLGFIGVAAARGTPARQRKDEAGGGDGGVYSGGDSSSDCNSADTGSCGDGGGASCGGGGCGGGCGGS